MPRRAVTKCSRRHAGERPGQTEELCLVWGHCFGVADWERPLESRAEFSRLWGRWGAEITRRWSKAYPGSRPVGSYLAGEIEPPAWRHELPALRHPVRIGEELAIEDRAWHCREIELDHLVGLGIVDDDEYEAALERLAGSEPTAGRRYEALAPG
jgi:hypothetical protein